MRIVFLMGLMCLSVTGTAQYIIHSVHDVWMLAHERNVTVQIASEHASMARADQRQAYANFLPSVTAQGTFTDNLTLQPTLIPASLFGGEAGTYLEETFGKRYTYATGISAQLDVFNATHWKTLRTTRAALELRAAEHHQSQRDIDGVCADAYYQIWYTHRMLLLATESMNLEQQLAAHAERQWQEGRIRETDYLAADLRYRQAQRQRQRTLADEHTAIHQLKSLLGLSPEDTLVLTEADDDLFALAMPGNAKPATSVDERVMIAQLELAKASWQVTRAAYLPTLSVVYAMNVQVAGDDFVQFNNSNTLPQQYWGLRLSLPILSNGMRTRNEANAAHTRTIAHLQWEDTQNRTTLEDTLLRRQLRDDKEALQLTQAIVDQSLAQDNHAEAQFTQGQLSLPERLQSRLTYLRHRQDFLLVQYEYAKHLAAWQLRQQP